MPEPTREILFEIIRLGAYAKVIAVDATSGTEAVTQGPANASDNELKAIGFKKLLFVMKKKKA